MVAVREVMMLRAICRLSKCDTCKFRLAHIAARGPARCKEDFLFEGCSQIAQKHKKVTEVVYREIAGENALRWSEEAQDRARMVRTCIAEGLGSDGVCGEGSVAHAVLEGAADMLMEAAIMTEVMIGGAE